MRTIFHGSNVYVPAPEILKDGYYKDFGYGFYCTEMKSQAVKWALTKRNEHILNSYDYCEDASLKILKFNEMTEGWLDFIASCRRGKEHSYDIVEGPMANDTVWNYVEDFVRGAISRQAFWELAKFRHPTHQIVFCTEEALGTISYTGGEKV